ncbi:MAG: SpoIIE family protein phosphatase [Thermoanaerobaculum sp.]|nr:SpoIIE family protein phosphatase [Thermoanaerobaculum sp.]
MLRLALALPDGTNLEKAFLQGPILVGRAEEANLVLTDLSLSRRHALLEQQGDRWTVRDLGSRNGTLLNGRTVTSPTPLQVGDQLQMGKVRMTVLECGPTAEVAEREVGETTLLAPVAKVLHDTGVDGVPVDRDAPRETLRRYAERLSLLARVHKQLAAEVTQEGLLQLVLDQAFLQLHPDQAAVFLKDENGSFVCVASRCGQDCQEKLLLSRSLVREVVGKKAAALVVDAFTDARFNEALSLRTLGVRSIVAVPLLMEDTALGLLVCASRLSVRRFTQEDLEFLVPLASVAAMRLRNLWLAQEAAEKRRPEQELALARRIQVGLFREEVPRLAGYEIWAGNIPSHVVSGDFYQLLPAPGGCTLLVADVAGKGMGAALLAASLEALFAGPLSLHLPPAEVCQKVSDLFFARTDPAKYATCFLAHLEAATGVVRYCNAGHCPGLVVGHLGQSRQLPSTGPPLGMFPEQTYRQQEVTLQPGDTLILYSDGVTETTDPRGEEFGLARLLELFQRHRHLPLPQLLEALEEELEQFSQTPSANDDRTLVLLRRLEA